MVRVIRDFPVVGETYQGHTLRTLVLLSGQCRLFAAAGEPAFTLFGGERFPGRVVDGAGCEIGGIEASNSLVVHEHSGQCERASD